MWRARWRSTIVHQCVQRRKNHWARKSSLVEARRICDAFIKRNGVANISRSSTTSIRGGTPTTSCKSPLYHFLSILLTRGGMLFFPCLNICQLNRIVKFRKEIKFLVNEWREKGKTDFFFFFCLKINEQDY